MSSPRCLDCGGDRAGGVRGCSCEDGGTWTRTGPNTDLLNYVFPCEGGTGTVIGTASWDSNYVRVFVYKRNVDWYCPVCDLFTNSKDRSEGCFQCHGLLQEIEADPDERMLGWETVRPAALVRQHKEGRPVEVDLDDEGSTLTRLVPAELDCEDGA